MWTTVEAHKSHRQWCMEFLMNIDFSYGNGTNTDRMPQRLIWNRLFDIDKYSMAKENPNKGVYTHGPHNGHLQCHVDGSFDPATGVAASGVNIALGAIQLSYNIGQSSIYLAELFSIKKCLQWLLHNNDELSLQKDVTIFCDSQSVVKTLAKIQVSSKLVFKILDLLNAVARLSRSLKVVWIRAHVDDANLANPNGLADRLAKAGLCLPKADDSPLPPWGLVKADLVAKTNALWGRLWRSQPLGRQSKHWFPGPDANRSMKLLALNRKKYGKLCQLFSGHNSLLRHLHICTPLDEQDLPTSPTCQRCGLDEDTSEHFIGDCEPLAALRMEIFGDHTLFKPFDNLEIHKVLSFMLRSQVTPLDWSHQAQLDQQSQGQPVLQPAPGADAQQQ